MKTRGMILAALLLAAVAHGQSYIMTVDPCYPDRALQTLAFLQATAPRLDVYAQECGRPYTNLTGHSLVLKYGTGAVANAFATLTNSSLSTSAGYFRFNIPATQLNTNGTFWYTTLWTNTAGNVIYSGRGSLKITATTATGNAGTLDLDTPLNLDLYDISGTVPLANLSGITSNQMDATTDAAYRTAATPTLGQVLAAGNSAESILRLTNSAVASKRAEYGYYYVTFVGPDYTNGISNDDGDLLLYAPSGKRVTVDAPLLRLPSGALIADLSLSTNGNASELRSGTVPLARLSGVVTQVTAGAGIATTTNGGIITVASAETLQSIMARGSSAEGILRLTNSAVASKRAEYGYYYVTFVGPDYTNGISNDDGDLLLYAPSGKRVTVDAPLLRLPSGALIADLSLSTNANASELRSGTVPLARLSGITSNQLDATTDGAYRSGAGGVTTAARPKLHIFGDSIGARRYGGSARSYWANIAASNRFNVASYARSSMFWADIGLSNITDSIRTWPYAFTNNLLYEQAINPEDAVVLPFGANDLSCYTNSSASLLTFSNVLSGVIAWYALPDNRKSRAFVSFTLENDPSATTQMWSLANSASQQGIRMGATQATARATNIWSGTHCVYGVIHDQTRNPTFEVLVDGVNQTAIGAASSTNSTYPPGNIFAISRTTGQGFSPTAYIFGPFADGIHTSVLRVVSAGTNNHVYCDYFGAWSTNDDRSELPRVAVWNVKRNSDAKYASPGSTPTGIWGGSDAQATNMSVVVSNVVYTLYNAGLDVRLVDLLNGLNKTTHLDADGIHLSVSGNAEAGALTGAALQ